MRQSSYSPLGSARNVPDISNNAARSAMVESIAKAVALRAPPPLDLWSSMGDCAPHPTPAIPIGNVWKQLNSLRVMEQYISLLGEMCASHPFLQGDSITCVQGLEWFSRFAQPLKAIPADVRKSLERTVDIYRDRIAGTTPDRKQAAYEIHHILSCSDRAMTQLLLEYNFPNVELKEYDIDVCAWMIAQHRTTGRTYRGWLEAMPRWRKSGLFYPIAIGATYMPGIENWLPSEVHSSPVGLAFGNMLASFRDPHTDHLPALKALASAWENDATGASHILAGTIDRLAVLMGVRSNGDPHHEGGFSLKQALDAFPKKEAGISAHESNYRAWTHIRGAIENTFPPSLLCAPLVRPKRPTWGHERLTLKVSGDPWLRNCVVRFAEVKLDCVQPDPSGGMAHTYCPAFSKACMAQQTSFRIQDVLWRLGEVALSPDVASCMVDPTASLETIRGTRQELATITPREALAFMDCTAPVDKDYMAYMECLDATVPPVKTHTFPSPQAVLMWRIDLPSQGIVYVGSGAEFDIQSESQHHLRKVLVNCRAFHNSHVGDVLSAPASSGCDTVRNCIMSYAALDLALHPSNTILVKGDDKLDAAGGRQVAPVTCTTLAESIACLSLRAPSNITTCNLGGSCSWKDGGIDPRYAERQLAENGFRFRDWVAMHVGKAGTQQSRLASHVIRYNTLYSTQMPWISDDGGDVRWVRVSCTSKPESRTLQGLTLRQAVESRFLHDLRMLPTPVMGDAMSEPLKVERSNAELYVSGANKVAIAYAPTGQTNLEFIAFEF